jgi:hypothetical protein
MKPRWLILAVSVICLLVLAPATVLSQQLALNVGCGTPTVDGRVGSSEWTDATTVPLYGHEKKDEEAVDNGIDLSPTGFAPSQNGESYVVGTAYLLHDGQHLYVGAVLPDSEDRVPDSAPYYDLWMAFAFEDEPAAMPGRHRDCLWDAASCAQSDEGNFMGAVSVEPEKNFANGPIDEVTFIPWAAEHFQCWDDQAKAQGVRYEAGRRAGGGHYEMRINLNTSALDNVGVGDCFDMRWVWAYYGAGDMEVWASIEGGWPLEQVDEPPYEGECTVLCLDPCGVEEATDFVPEPGTLLLLGSGMAGLAGYATLRWRSRA